ncbi:hypothetical protein FisN_5Lh316 [Fistulifera solaris]|uniref:CW-type domain-containing protein n=1 Tax=Fistulifera solaris TaxID=1519565 RepID=A0A1Z5KFZ5_FISSO|nr:hypothetical protein FisN_5Lh316 [Fistulifera solaris]|eukprot:GAX25234.1 hypothetical protein FisN_5Lh316 [Fistulifera solaris]
MENNNEATINDDKSDSKFVGSANNASSGNQINVSAPANNYKLLGILRRGDLVRVSTVGAQNMKCLRDRDKSLGRIVEVDDKASDGATEQLYTVEWIIQGGKTSRIQRDYLVHTTASAEGMIDDNSGRRNSRKRRKPESYEEDAKKLDDDKKRKKIAESITDRSSQEPVKPEQAMEEHEKVSNARIKVEQENAPQETKRPLTFMRSLPKRSTIEKVTDLRKQSGTKEKKGISKGKQSGAKEKQSAVKEKHTSTKEKRVPKAKQNAQEIRSNKDANESSHALDLYEKHRREFERIIDRLEKKVDKYRLFSDEDPDNGNDDDSAGGPNRANDESHVTAHVIPKLEGSGQSAPENILSEKSGTGAQSTSLPPTKSIPQPLEVKSSSPHLSKRATDDKKGDSSPDLSEFPPLNWKMIRRRMELGFYVLNREKVEEDNRFYIMEDYYNTLDKKPRRYYLTGGMKTQKRQPNSRVKHPLGVNWDRFRDDVLAMCDTAIDRESDDQNDSFSMTAAANKIKEQMLQAFERTGRKQMQEMTIADGVHKFLAAIERSENKEAAMQSHREGPFPERLYERLSADTVCDGLSKVDKEIAIYERQTSLKDSFVGLAYRYDDTGQSEAWMKSVVDETALNGKSRDKVRQAALALSADDGVTRAQVVASMQSLLIGVQDKVLTEKQVLSQAEISSVNWKRRENHESMNDGATKDESLESEAPPEIVEQPVWGIDCYTRRNITACLQIEFDPRTSLQFVEKWLLPAINACPVEYAQDIRNAAKLLEGLPLNDENDECSLDAPCQDQSDQQTILGAALRRKIEAASPPWLKAAAFELRQARSCLGPNFFRIHPKGHGSVLLSQQVDANRLVTFYRGELYPSWRWGEKMDAISMTQDRKNLKPALPDFYNMALERPQIDPRGYGLLFVDASRKAGYGSSLSHSCDPTCEVRVAAKNGELCLAMTTLRELEMGEELTFDYHAVTESLNEYKSAVCLCGYGKCRGSFLHFATADCYQQVLNRNAPIATRFSNLVKGSTKQVMSDDDERVLRNHGFNTAAFGAISVNRRVEFSIGGKSSLMDSLDLVPVWLKTYVADTLRYIEYERRALPISLICDHLSSARQEKDPAIAVSQTSKPPGREPAFFCYSRVENTYLLSLLRKDPVYQSLSGLELKGAVKKLASNLWQKMSEEKKNIWKKRAQTEYEEKKKVWLLSEDLRKRDGAEVSGKSKVQSSQQRDKGMKKRFGGPDIQDVLFSSKISFEDADAEGVSAMEQRIQQLTQSLNRVGRVLDRHREGVLEASTEGKSAPDLQTLRQIIHAPISLLSDEAVVNWMWSSEMGAVQTLLRSAREAQSSRPSLIERLDQLRKEKYAFLADFRDPSIETTVSGSSSSKGIEGRLQLKNALLDMREIILDELKDMAREFRRSRSLTKGAADRGENAVVLPTDHMDLSDEDVRSGDDNGPPPIGVLSEEKDFSVENESGVSSYQILRKGKNNGLPPEERNVIKPAVVSSGNAITRDIQTVLPAVVTEESIGVPVDSESQSGSNNMIGDKGSGESNHKNDEEGAPRKTCGSPANSSWLLHYDQRFSLQAAADALLLYAHTSNFFTMKAYQPLESSPVDVYAREIGNSVPLSVIDEVVDASRITDEKNENICERRFEDKNSTMICRPDDIVASVTVRYEGDYVLSQLLQWYNGGIGQKQGLPDLLGCVMLPSIDGCWRSSIAKRRRKPEKKTLYESKVRPRLIEWFQDPFQRGSPWPEEIRQAFTVESEELSKLDNSCMQPFGSPILDFLVTGDESNIHDVLNMLDAEEKVAARNSVGGLLSSVDRGRPAQAVSTWVQCESADCMKWRKIPWHVDVDLLPEKFYCKDNIWNPLANSCDAPEDDWDANDSLVDANGKVEGSPIKKRKRDSSASPLDEKSFTIGARFDVRRHDKEKYEVGVVSKVDFSGKIKRIQFHFPKLSRKFDEWIDFGSERIARLHTHVPKKAKHSILQTQSDNYDTIGQQEANATSVVNPKDIKIGVSFDVYRDGDARASVGVVERLDIDEERKRILFHFPRTNVSEWHDFDSRKIRTHRPRKSRDSVDGFSLKNSRCPVVVEYESMKVGDVFAVYRDVIRRTSTGVVVQTEVKDDQRRVLFRFPRANPQITEWYDFDLKKIRPYQSRANKQPSNAFNLKTARCPQTVDEETIEVGDVFDVYRESVKRASMGVVKQIEFAGDRRRVLFHFPRANSQLSEWCDFDTNRIKPYKPRANKENGVFSIKTARCPVTVDAATIEEGDVFNVYRASMMRSSIGVVKEIDFTENRKRVLFLFPRTNPQVSEWCDFDTKKIKPYKPRSNKENGAFSLKTARCPSTVDAETIEEGDVFDVFRDSLMRYSIGVVKESEFTEDRKRVLFFFPRTNPPVSEWCDFDTNKIKPYKPRTNQQPNSAFSLKTARCPTIVDVETMEEGDVYDVHREGALRWNVAVVEQIEQTEKGKRALFHFPRINPQLSEWLNLDNLSRVRPFNRKAKNSKELTGDVGSDEHADQTSKEQPSSNGLDLLLSAINGQASNPGTASSPQPDTIKQNTSMTPSLNNFMVGQSHTSSGASPARSSNSANPLAPLTSQRSSGVQSVHTTQTQDSNRLINFGPYSNPYCFNVFNQSYGVNYNRGGGLNGNPVSQFPPNLPTYTGGPVFNPQAFGMNPFNYNGVNPSSSTANKGNLKKAP